MSTADGDGEGLSVRWGPTEPPLYTGTIPQHFAATVARHGDRPAVVARAPRAWRPDDGGGGAAAETALTYHGLDVASNRLASSLASLGVRPGHRVAVSLGNVPEFAAVTYALYKLGAVLVPLNPALSPAQVVAALRHLDVGILVVAAVADLPYKPARGRCNRPLVAAVAHPGPSRDGALLGDRVRSGAVPSLRHVVVVDNRALHLGHDPAADAWPVADSRGALVSYAALAAHGSPAPVVPARPLEPSDTINIQFTSGTTSAPKAAMLTHASILNNGALIARRMGLDAADRIVVPPPLFHCFGSVLGYMATASVGAAILFPSPAFDPVATLRMCVDHAATGLYGVATMLVSVLDALDRPGVLAPGSRGPAHLRKGIVAGSSVPESLMRSIYRRLGLDDVVICYGMTETSPVSCMTTPADPLVKRTSSVGRPMPHTGVKIVSPTDRSVIQPLNTRGELAAAGYLVMKGYYGDQARTAAVRVREPDPQGPPGASTVWMYSGDEAVMDQDGYVSITGRIKDLIIRGGENIHPLEVENCLFQLPGVQEVCVLGLPDDRLGESVAAFVIPARGWATADRGADVDADVDADADDGAGPGRGTLTKDRVRDWVRSHLSSHLVPKHVFWATEFPKTASGKIQKFKLRDTAADALKTGRVGD